ncbi:MAG TPA: Gfo/Idh/MocA family oxidoreductase [Plantibacter sp.]|uniref:Gfo/Idh/MocA family protein n=1 Tax=unclassified Plantibacter TaxID=2624265 RepID=UPI002BC285C5|nr:Gfo/Idh/MocA family oxidoreductase [Plantibacter sp.]
MTTNRERYALIGTGHRSQMYLDAIAGPHADVAELVAWSDSNPGRLDHYEGVLTERGLPLPARYGPDDVERLIEEQRVDRVIITTPDFTHAEIVSRALLAGADVVVEKPLTIDREGVERIADAVERSGRRVITTFNYRYSPRNSEVRRIVQDGRIGRVTSVHFEWVLDTVHGADYFRRWHREKEHSGGLLIHKASHHFDLVNWWIDARPASVYASGGLRFYGDENAAERGLGARPARGSDPDDATAAEHGRSTDPFALDLRDDPRLESLYLKAEQHDGYLRDRDVFSPGISIEDNLSVLVDYDGGATLSYSLNAHAPWEGYRVSINGTEGRVELEVVERAAVLVGSDGRVVLDPSLTEDGADAASVVRPRGERLILQRHWEQATEIAIPAGVGGHGGGDAFLLQHLFDRVTEDELGRPAGYDDGVRAISVGIAGNESLLTGRPVATIAP